MRHILAVICGIALLISIGEVPGRLLAAQRGSFGPTDGAFTVFILSGGLSVVLYYLHELRREARAQTQALEEIARNTRKGDKPAASSVHYRIPGLNE